MPKWFVDNKTKIAGAVILLIGFLQTTDNATVLTNLMGASGYSIFNMVMGAIVIVLGFWNTSEIKKQGNGFAVLSALFLLAVLSWCAMYVAASLRLLT